MCDSVKLLKAILQNMVLRIAIFLLVFFKIFRQKHWFSSYFTPERMTTKPGILLGKTINRKVKKTNYTANNPVFASHRRPAETNLPFQELSP